MGPIRAEGDPFAVLGIAPTMDVAQVKRAYFEQLKVTPPHGDPEGFRRLRAAYEALLNEHGRALAFARAPLDVKAFLRGWRERWAEPLARAKARREKAGSQLRAAQALVEELSRLGWDEVLRR